MPGPVSATTTSTRASRRAAASVIRATFGQNLSALSTRLATARSKSSMSTAAKGAEAGEAMRLRVIEEQSTDEVCRALGISEENLFVRIHRARKQLLS